MPIKKTNSENSEQKSCPFCGEEIKATALKCKHCGEYLNESGKKATSDESKQSQSNDALRVSAINSGKFLCRGYVGMFVLLGVAFLGGFFDLDFIYSDGFSAIDVLSSLAVLVLLMVWCNKSYKYILSIGAEHLHYDSTGWPTWGWICPFANLVVPYYSVQDIYKTHIKTGGTAIVGWWRACYLISTFMLNLSDKDDSGFVALLGLGFLVAEYILIMNIIKKINGVLES